MAARIAGVLAGAIELASCAAGSGPLVTYSATGREDPGTTRDTPPSTRDDTAGSCIACDVNYNCNGPGQSSSGSECVQGNCAVSVPTQFGAGGIELSTDGGTCIWGLIDFVCSGVLFGATGCTGGGGGAFTCGDTTCTPGPAQSAVIVTPEPTPIGTQLTGSSSTSGGI